MKYSYRPSGVCSTLFEFDIEDNIIKDVKLENGCAGNLLGIKRLITGMPVKDVIDKFEGIDCSGKNTSCPDQISKALKAYLLESK